MCTFENYYEQLFTVNWLYIMSIFLSFTHRRYRSQRKRYMLIGLLQLVFQMWMSLGFLNWEWWKNFHQFHSGYSSSYASFCVDFISNFALHRVLRHSKMIRCFSYLLIKHSVVLMILHQVSITGSWCTISAGSF